MGTKTVKRSDAAPTSRRKKWLRSILSVAVASVLIVPLDLPIQGGNTAPAFSAQDPHDPWPGGAPGENFESWAPTVFIGQQTAPTQLFRVEQVIDIDNQNQTTGDGEFTRIGSDGHITYNALAYRSSDHYLYAMQTDVSGSSSSSSKRVLRIGQGGKTEFAGRATGLHNLAQGGTWNAGTFGEGIHSDSLFVRPSLGPMERLYSIDVPLPGSESEPGELDVENMLLTQTVPNTADLVYKDGMIWTFGQTNNRHGIVYRIDLEANADGKHQVSTFPIDYGPGSGRLVFGAQWMYGNGNIGLSDNALGRIFQFEIQNPLGEVPTFHPIFAEPLKGSRSSLNDGAAKNSPTVDLAIEKGAPTRVIAGSSFEFTLTVQNLTDSWSSGYVVEDVVPAEFIDVETLTSGCNSLVRDTGETEVKCVGGMLAPHTSAEIRIRANLPTDTIECVPNMATVLGNEHDPVTSNNESITEVCPAAPGLRVFKSATASSAPDDPRVGDRITYQVDITNIGGSIYTSDNPAIATDDLQGVLDDASVVSESLELVEGSGGDLSYDAPRITWTGQLGPGETASYTFEVLVEKGGDGRIRNVVFEGEGGTPACAPPVLDWEVEVERWIDVPTGVPCYSTEHLLPMLTISKVADLQSLPSDEGPLEVTYEIQVTNNGPGTASTPAATMTDDLTRLLPAATYIDGTLSADVGSVEKNGEVIEWHGDLDSSETATISFKIRYDPDLDESGILTNVACVLERETAAGVDHCASATLRSLRTSQWKEMSASHDPIVAGTVLTYTLHFANQGAVDFEVDAVDVLDDVLDDATLTAAPTVTTMPPTSGPLVATYEPENERITVSGTLLEGERASVTYAVTVKEESERGNNRSVNFLIDADDTPPEDCIAADDRPNCTETPLPGSLIWYKVDDHYNALAGSVWALIPVSADGQPTGAQPMPIPDCIADSPSDCDGHDRDPAAGSFKVVGLDYGSYALAETVSPAGYLLNLHTEQVDLAIAEQDLGEFLNFQQFVPEIPLTGGFGAQVIQSIGALALLTMAGLMLWRTRRRHG